MNQEKLINKAIQETSKELVVPEDIIQLIISLNWKFIREKIQDIDISSINSKEDLDKLKSSFNLPSFGKLYTSIEKINKLRNQYNFLLNKERNDKTK